MTALDWDAKDKLSENHKIGEPAINKISVSFCRASKSLAILDEFRITLELLSDASPTGKNRRPGTSSMVTRCGFAAFVIAASINPSVSVAWNARDKTGFWN